MKQAVLFSIPMLLLLLAGVPASTKAQSKRVLQAEYVNTSLPLAAMKRAPVSIHSVPYAIPNKPFKFGGAAAKVDIPGFVDPVLQVESAAKTNAAIDVTRNFEGSSDDDNAAQLGYRVVPPDTEGDVGPNHYVQWINSVAEIFDKNGNSLMGPVPGNQFFQGMGGPCESENDGDPIVLYDELAGRWVVSQFVASAPYYECVAVSATGDPMGAYHQYAFPFGNNFPDYPKLGVWPDAYYMTIRNFVNGGSFGGVQAVAMEREKMLIGQPAQMILYNIPGGTQNDGWLPADFDGTAPPAGTPGIFAGAPSTDGSNEIELYSFNVNWSNPSSSSFTKTIQLGTQPFDSVICGSLFNGCIEVPKGRGAQALDEITGFLMYRLQYRNFGTYEVLLLNHTVDPGTGKAGIRWYELRRSGGPWSIHQQGTFAPNDGLHRWMGSIAMNANGDIALGYSVSGTSLYPSIRVTGQTAAGSAARTGVMDVPETEILAGGGTQTNANRWGDYSSMSVDPNGSTFWFTTEYYEATASFDFKTRIAAFNISGGGTTPTVPAPPSDLVATTVSSSQIDLAWADNSTDETGFLIERATSGGAFAEIASVGSNTTSFNNTGLAASTSYSYRVRATNAAGPSTYSNTASATTQAAGPSSTMHIDLIVTGTQNASRGNKYGTATVTVRDNNGNAVSGVTVTGNFSGSYNDTGRSGVTDASSNAFITTASTQKGGVTVNFCVSDISGSLAYVPADNTSSSYACAGSNQPSTLASSTPEGYTLESNYPNPFNPSTVIAFAIPEAARVTLRVYNVLGQEVATLVDGFREAGRHEATFDAERLSAGVYLYTIQAGPYTATRRMTLLK